MRAFRFFGLILSLVLFCGACDGAPVQFQDSDANARNAGHLSPFPTQIDPNAGYLETMATPTFEVGTSAAVLIPTLPAGTVVFAVTSINGATNFGPSDVASGSGVEDYIASGSTRYFDALATTTPNYWFIGQTSSATEKVRPIGIPR